MQPLGPNPRAACVHIAGAAHIRRFPPPRYRVEIEREVTGRRPLTFLGCFWFDSGILAAGRAPVYRSGLGAF